MLKRIEDFGNGAVATVEKVGELQTKLTGVLGKLGFQQESSEARLLRDEFIDQNAYMVMTGANMLFKLFMEKEKTSQSLFKAIERVADKMTNISADMIKIATALLENLNKQQQQLTATLDAEIFQALAAKRDLTTKIAIVGDRKWETQKQKNEGKISEENYKATMELLDKEVAALKEAFESEEKSRDKIIKLIEEQQKIMHTAIESYNKNHAATRELVQSIVTQQKETMREIAQLFSDISKDNNSLLKEIIQIGASYVKSEQEHKHALEMAKNGVKPSELPAAKSAPQLPGPNGNGSAAPNGNHMSSGDNNANFDALDKVYRSGKSNYRQLCAEAKKGVNADQVRLSSFFESADTLFGQSYSKYKKLDKNKLNESEKRKVEKRIGKLKDPDGKYSPTKLLAGKSP